MIATGTKTVFMPEQAIYKQDGTGRDTYCFTNKRIDIKAQHRPKLIFAKNFKKL